MPDDFDLQKEAEKIKKEYENKIAAAVKKIEKRVEEEMKKIIKECMIDNYYNGYTPKVYNRIWQLKKSVGPFVQTVNIGGEYNISFGVEDEEPYGPSAMNHSVLMVTITYKSKKSGKTTKKTYAYNYYGADEQRIFNEFLDGYHHNVGPANTYHVATAVQYALDDFFDNKAEVIVRDELGKIK